MNRSKLWQGFTLVALVAVAATSLLKPNPVFPKLIKKPVIAEQFETQWHADVASDMLTVMVHAPSMLELPNGDIRAFWFAGTREGAKDVSINSAVFDKKTARWQAETTIINRPDLNASWGRYVRKLGNVVPVLDNDNSIRLFVTAPSFGGWAASRIVVYKSQDLGKTWQFQTELKLSPFLNISTLVKTPPLYYQDGSIGLPVYHEFLGKFGELVRLDKNNRILSVSRIGQGRLVLQPLILENSESELVSYMRPSDHNGYAYQSKSTDSGKTWSPLSVSSIQNPGAALGGVRLAKDHFLTVSNCDKDERDVLCVEESMDAGKTWRIIKTFHNEKAFRGKNQLHYEAFIQQYSAPFKNNADVDYPRFLKHVKQKVCSSRKGCEFRVDYPYMIQTKNGDIHIVYTWNKVFIRHLWLKAKGETR